MGKPRIKLAPFPAGAVVSPTAKGPGQDNLWPAVRGVDERASPETPTRVSLNVSLWALSMP